MKSAKPKVLTRKELGAVKKLFRLYQDRNGTIDPHEIVTSMQTLRLNEKSPVIYELNEKLSDKDSQKPIARVYEVFLGDSPSETLSFEAIKKVVEDVGDDMTDTQIRELLERATQNGKDMTFEEFYAIMTKKIPA